jgi:hypothetical protein
MSRGQEFQFVCSDNMAGKMDRIVTFAGGVIRSKEQHENGTVIMVMKAE